jgi:uncharacterized protein YjiS (DUF1127 family)
MAGRVPALGCQHPLGNSLGRKVASLARHVWARYWTRRAQHATVAVLSSLDDRALKDIGLDRSEIPSVVYGERRSPRDDCWEKVPGAGSQLRERRLWMS